MSGEQIFKLLLEISESQKDIVARLERIEQSQSLRDNKNITLKTSDAHRVCNPVTPLVRQRRQNWSKIPKASLIIKDDNLTIERKREALYGNGTSSAPNKTAGRSTLYKLVKSDAPALKRGRKHLLTDEQEAVVVAWINDLRAHGIHVSKQTIMVKLRTSVNPSQTFSYTFIKAFLKRHKLSLRMPASHSAIKDPDQAEKAVAAFLAGVSLIATSENIRPSKTINLDETRLAAGVSHGRTIDAVGAVNVRVVDEQEKFGITCMSAGAMTGQMLPNTYNLPKSNPPFTVTSQCKNALTAKGLDLKDFHLVVSQSGYTNNQVMKEWFEQVFVPYVSGAKSILILDMYSGHHRDEDTSDDEAFLDLAALHNCFVLFVPAGLTSKLQPLDVGFFGPAKQQFNCAKTKARLEQFEIDRTVRHLYREDLIAMWEKICKSSDWSETLRKGWLKAHITNQFRSAEEISNISRSIMDKTHGPRVILKRHRNGESLSQFT